MGTDGWNDADISGGGGGGGNKRICCVVVRMFDKGLVGRA